MRILAIDTSVGAGSVAAVDDEGGVERPLGPQGEHARVLAGALVEVADRRGWRRDGPALAAADLVAVVRGPGSFTGLRVGVSAAKALAWSCGARLAGVSGFEVVARRTARVTGWNDALITVAFDAGRGDVYATTVEPSAGGWRVADAVLVPRESWIDALPRGSRVSGPALGAWGERLAARGRLEIAPPEAWFPAATDVAEAARSRAIAGAYDDPRTLVPEYLRPSYAEEARRPGP